MRKFTLCIVLLLPFVYIYSQDLDYYYVEFKEGHVPQNIQKTVNTDQTLTLTMDNTNLAAALNEKPIFTFEKAFPYSNRNILKRVYLLSISQGIAINTIVNRIEVETYESTIIEDMRLNNVAAFTILPNDYYDIITGGRNTAMDLIRAPLAWTITRGDGVIVGVSDSKIDLNHEDLVGQIIMELDIPPRLEKHGTGVAGQIAAKTNNNKGIASIAHEAKIISAPNTGHNIVQQLSQISGVKVINTSWVGCGSSSYIEELYQEILESGVLVVSAAGNGSSGGSCGDGHGYAYPASYNSTLSVTTVGHRIAPTYYHTISACSTCQSGWVRSWKDVHETRPDTPETFSTTHNDKVDITAPGQLLTLITDKYDDYPSGYALNVNHTSPATPIVAGVAALVFSANPSLTATQVKDIIKNTADDIYHIPYNQPYVGLLGTGRVNAYRAVLTAKCMDDPTYIGNLDLMVRNSMVDYGIEPDINTEITGSVMWNTQEIWIRNNSGESYIDVHQNPEYDPVIPNYVNVRVTNRSCVTSSGTEELTLYWAKANTALNWPINWDGSLTMGDITNTNSTVPTGGAVGTLNIPPLQPGQEVILEFEWMVPNPEDYFDLNENPWHFCLLARIESIDDPMTFPESILIIENVRNNNNLGWKNTTVVDIVPNTPTIGGLVAVSNPFSSSKTYNLELFPEAGEFGKALYQEAEIGVEMDEVLYQAWSRGNKEKSNLKATSNDRKFIATDKPARIENIQFHPNEYGTAYLTFNFLTKEISNKQNYTYHLAQIDASNNKVIGGETFEIRKQPRSGFLADAGNDKEIDRSDSVTLEATDINEDAVYNWYDVDGNLIYTGTSLTVTPQFTQQYQLEVISNLDGLKDYDELQVTVNPYKIESLVPNPAASTVTVNYIAENATSAYIMVVHQNSGNSSNYIIDTLENAHTIDLSSFASGLYSIILVCDGDIQGSKNLLKL